MTSVARFVTGSRERHRAFARWFVTIDALGPGLKMLTMTESQRLLRRSFGRRGAPRDSRRHIQQRRRRERSYQNQFDL